MSAFTAAEIEYLTSQRLGRLATVGPDGQPHIIPVTYVFNAEQDTIDIGGMRFGAGKKWRDATHNPKICFLVDESWGTGAKGIEIRGEAELHETGGESINPRFPQFAPQFFRLRPRRVVAWGIDPKDDDPYALNARDVG
jgi:pyridoxamine 5'-phosphate oxidase family protein